MEKGCVTCKLEIINLDLIIKTKDIQYKNFEQEKCKSHIKTLLDLKRRKGKGRFRERKIQDFG